MFRPASHNRRSIRRIPRKRNSKTWRCSACNSQVMCRVSFALLRELYESTDKPHIHRPDCIIQLATETSRMRRKPLNWFFSKYTNSSDSLDVFLDETNKQKVPVNAAAWNMKGYIPICSRRTWKGQRMLLQSAWDLSRVRDAEAATWKWSSRESNHPYLGLLPGLLYLCKTNHSYEKINLPSWFALLFSLPCSGYNCACDSSVGPQPCLRLSRQSLCWSGLLRHRWQR